MNKQTQPLKKRSKLTTILIGVGAVLVACCGLSAISAVISPKATPAATPTANVQTALVEPAATTQPIGTPPATAEPTQAPTAVPTDVPTDVPAPTAAPASSATEPPVAVVTEAPASAPAVAAGQPISTNPTGKDPQGNNIVDPPWLPCAEGQIKGSKNGKYHVPGGRYYARTYSEVTCFNSEAEAQAAQFVRALNQ